MDWQQQSFENPLSIIADVDGGYGDDGRTVHFTRICEVEEGPDAEKHAALIVRAVNHHHELLGIVKTLCPLLLPDVREQVERVIASAEGGLWATWQNR